MSPRSTGRDADGRPIVAELGRAETPSETADRKAAATAKRRANQTSFNLVIALVISLLVGFVFVFSWVARPTESLRPPVDYEKSAADAQAAAPVPLAVPELPEGWTVNRATYEAGGTGITTWRVGFLTPSEQYIGLFQGIDADNTWVSQQTAEAEATDRFVIGGLSWNEYDRRDVDDPGNLAYALQAAIDGSIIVLSGTATDEEFEQLAEAVAASVPAGEAP